MDHTSSDSATQTIMSFCEFQHVEGDGLNAFTIAKNRGYVTETGEITSKGLQTFLYLERSDTWKDTLFK